MRLDRFLTAVGGLSRSRAGKAVRAGRVTVNGLMAALPEQKIDELHDTVLLDGALLRYRAKHYVLLDKPEGVITAAKDPRQPTVLDLLPPELRRLGLFPVGRLDKDTSGLLLLTNDGEFAHRVISPKSGVEKRYRAEVEGIPDEEDVRAFAEGIVLADGTRCLPAKLEITGESLCFVTVMEGKYHQVKRMLAARGKPVTALRRLSVGELTRPESLAAGAVRELDASDLCKVLRDYVIGK